MLCIKIGYNWQFLEIFKSSNSISTACIITAALPLESPSPKNTLCRLVEIGQMVKGPVCPKFFIMKILQKYDKRHISPFNYKILNRVLMNNIQINHKSKTISKITGT